MSRPCKLLIFNKPFQVLSQFTDPAGRSTLADYLTLPGFYPAGRLDYDSEGLLLLTDDGQFQQRISNPRFKLAKTYLVQVEGLATRDQTDRLIQGITLNDGPARALSARLVDKPKVWDRSPPIRKRKQLPTSWLEIVIDEGRNRQIRRMTAHVGLPTLRLIRTQVGHWRLDELAPGEYRQESAMIDTPTPRKKHNSRHKRSTTRSTRRKDPARR